MIDKATVKRIIDAANIVEVVSDYVHLTRRGANYMGLCPFHNERTPSFSVSPAKGICHCFSCGKGGSPVNFIMEKEGINYHDALIRLANKYGIKVEERELSDEERAEQSRREAMLTVNEWAMRRFQENMNATEEGRSVGLAYFYDRGLTKQAIEKFKLGYALDKPTDIYDSAMRQGFDAEALCAVGICGRSQRDNRPYDRFRGRVIYPMINSAGKVIAFGGRGIKGEPAKYINSPESDIYHKSSELYGIYQAKNEIVRRKRCFLVEGYMDVIGMWQSGMENVVASSGTSLTDGQVALIHRFTDNITIIYDGDSAGIHASLRAIDICLAQKMNVTLLLLPDNDDPDSFARKNTPEQFRRYVDEHQMDFIEFKAHVLGHASTSAGRAEALKSMVESIALVSDLISRTLYIQECSRLMNIPESVITAEVAHIAEKVVLAQRKRREQARIKAEVPDSPASDTPPTPEANTGEVAQPLSRPADSLITVVERHVLEYVVKYGMLEFAGADKEPIDGLPTLLVAEFVRDELTLDNMSFTTPFFNELFLRILAMIPTFRAKEEEHRQQIKAQQLSEHEAWVQEISAKSMSIRELEIAEEKQSAMEHEHLMAEMRCFAAEWIGRELGSDPDDNVRRFVLDTITERYTLSMYHSKNMHVETEEEKIPELVPRAITEWKDAILLEQRKQLEKQLADAGAAGDTALTEQILRSIQENAAMRGELAKALGERILIPRR